METVKIYYVGHKPMKRDNRVRRSGRVWKGFGASVDVPAGEASLYLRFPDVWSQTKPDGKAPAPVAAPEPNTDGGGGSDHDLQHDDRMRGIVEAIQRLNPDDYTKANKPKVNRVVEEAGFNVSASEISEAMHIIGG